MPRTPLGCRGALGQTGNGEHGEASLGTFCSWKRPSMMLLHRSSSRLRSTTWSRTSSPGLAARRPRKVRLACIPPHQAQPLIAALVPIPLTWVPGPGLLSHPHEVPDMQFAHRVGHMQPLELKEQPWPVPRPGVETGGPDQGRPLATTPASSPLLPPPTYPLASPMSTHNSTLYSPGPSSSGGCWALPSLAPLRGARGVLVCLRPEHKCQAFPHPRQTTVGGAAQL